MIDDAEAIRSLLAAYGRLLDARDATGWAALFTAQGAWDGGARYGVIRGQPALADFVVREFAGTPPCVHMLSNMAVTVEGERATAWSRWLLVEQREAGLTIALAGSYSDVLVKLAEGWRFERRTVTLDLPVEAGA